MRTNLSNVINFILIQQTFSVCYMKKTVLIKLENTKTAKIQPLSFKNINSNGGKICKHKY